MASLRSNSVTLVIVVLITLALGSASSSAATEPACDAPLRDIVKVQNFPVAYICAEQQLALDPDNIDAMLVLARAAQELGQFELADTLSQKARGYGLNTGQKFAAYLISGIAQANQSKFLSAKVLLYRASDFARAEPERRLIREVLAQLNARSPWKFSASASLNPSTNINGGSLHDTIEFAGLEFSLDEDAQAQSGIGYSANVQLTVYQPEALGKTRCKPLGHSLTVAGEITCNTRQHPACVTPIHHQGKCMGMCLTAQGILRVRLTHRCLLNTRHITPKPVLVRPITARCPRFHHGMLTPAIPPELPHSHSCKTRKYRLLAAHIQPHRTR